MLADRRVPPQGNYFTCHLESTLRARADAIRGLYRAAKRNANPFLRTKVERGACPHMASICHLERGARDLSLYVRDDTAVRFFNSTAVRCEITIFNALQTIIHFSIASLVLPLVSSFAPRQSEKTRYNLGFTSVHPPYRVSQASSLRSCFIRQFNVPLSIISSTACATLSYP